MRKLNFFKPLQHYTL